MNRYTRARTVATLLTMTLMMGCAVTPPAEDEHAGHHPEATAGAGAAVGNTAPTAMAAMQAEMGANMKTMQEQMEKLRGTTDPQERQKLMQEHMQAMQKNMAAMRGMGGPMMGMMGGKGGPMMNMDPKQREDFMQRRIDMMQMMMEQMMMEQMMQHEQMKAPETAK